MSRLLPAWSRGLTWVELTAVIVITLVTGMLLSNVRATHDGALLQQVRADLRRLSAGIESYAARHHQMLPATLDDLTAAPAVMPQVPRDPFSRSRTAPYGYAVRGARYVVWSVGPDHAATITGINDRGVLQGTVGDDLCLTNRTLTVC